MALALFFRPGLFRSAPRDPGFAGGAGGNTKRRASETDEAKTKLTTFLTSSGISSRSLRFCSDIRMWVKPLRCAARTFSLIPPTGSNLPVRVTSPVIA